MNNRLSALYTSITTPKAVKEEREAEALKVQADEAFKNETLNEQWNVWLQNPCTTILMKELKRVLEVNNRKAKLNALNQESSTIELIKVDTLEKVITYANHRQAID